uniref:uncharacterized protein n=1 Tax=Centroberyx gerrardi TaxID=166262 RepID=UPI003AAB5492
MGGQVSNLNRDTGGEMSPCSERDHKPSKRQRSFQDGADTEEGASATDLPDGLAEVQKLSGCGGDGPLESSVESCVSTQSDRSRELHPDFSNEPRPSGTNTLEARTASDSLINQLREDRKALQEGKKEFLEEKKAFLEEKKAFREEKKAFQEEKKAFLEEKRTKALDSLIRLKYGKSLHLSSEEEDLSALSSSAEDSGKKDDDGESRI